MTFFCNREDALIFAWDLSEMGYFHRTGRIGNLWFSVWWR